MQLIICVGYITGKMLKGFHHYWSYICTSACVLSRYHIILTLWVGFRKLFSGMELPAKEKGRNGVQRKFCRLIDMNTKTLTMISLIYHQVPRWRFLCMIPLTLISFTHLQTCQRFPHSSLAYMCNTILLKFSQLYAA